jgi:putative component of membrane protein insertase Oxa1/YidC/SpoIIIJ protein YidD
VAALTSVVMIQGVRVGLVRRTRCGPSCQEAVAHVFDALPATPDVGTHFLR